VGTLWGYGVAVKMITGDHLLIAKETARRLDMGDNILLSDGLPLLDPVTKQKPKDLSKKFGDTVLAADGFAQVFPEHKYLIVECLRELGYKTGMTGDGVNDAPALAAADVGIAMSTGTDIAMHVSGMTLMRGDPGLVPDAIEISKETWKKIKQNLLMLQRHQHRMILNIPWIIC
jgi:H+-transporting ATPase